MYLDTQCKHSHQHFWFISVDSIMEGRRRRRMDQILHFELEIRRALGWASQPIMPFYKMLDNQKSIKNEIIKQNWHWT